MQLPPALTWDLRLKPRVPLERVFWLDRLLRNKAYDTAVMLFYLIMLFCITPSWVRKLGWKRYLSGYLPTGFMIFLWIAALRDVALYSSYRTPIVTFVRIVMGLLGGQTANDMKDTIYTYMNFDSAVMTLLYKFVLLANTFELPIEAAAMQLPFLLQVVLLAFRAGCMLFTGCTKELIKFGNDPKYIAAAEEMTSTWAAIIQSVLPLAVPPCSRLAGRSTAIFMSLTALHFTTVLVSLYTVYISLWVDIRLWLRDKMICMRQQQPSSSSGAAGDVINIGGVMVSQDQLLAPYATRAASVMLSSSATGKAVAVCLHAVFVGVVCQLSLLLSQLFVYQLFPRLISESLLDEFYPLAPAAAE